MVRLKMFVLSILICVLFAHCVDKGTAKQDDSDGNKKWTLSFLSEFILPPNPQFAGTIVGGLSSIDYYEGKYYLICDDEKSPRFYTMTCDISNTEISNVNITDVVFLMDTNGKMFDKVVDPEALRFDKFSGNFLWCSEGKTKKGISPALYECNADGTALRSLTLPGWEVRKKEKKWGPRHNESLENLTISDDGRYIWVAQETPLKQDGKKPTHSQDVYPIRFSKIDKQNFSLTTEYVYPLGAIGRPSVEKNGTTLNGLAEIMWFDDNSFLTIERSYVSGYDDGGNDVKIYRAFIDDASDVSSFSSLKKSTFQPMKKELMVDFNLIKHTFPHGFVDNIEGICFGPLLPNGNKTILVVSDDNFGKYGPQANQFIVFELKSE